MHHIIAILYVWNFVHPNETCHVLNFKAMRSMQERECKTMKDCTFPFYNRNS